MGLRDRLTAAWSALRGADLDRGLNREVYYGTGSGGPVTADPWLLRRAPDAGRLVEAYRSLVYACANLNALAVARVPLRLYAVSGGVAGPRPRRACGPRPVGRSLLRHLRGVPHVARALAGADAVDEVTEHPLLEALDGATAEFDRPTLLYLTSLYLDVVGTAYWRLNPPAGVPTEFWPLPSQCVVAERPGLYVPPVAYSYLGERLAPDQLVRFRLVGPRDPHGDGYGPAQAAFAYAELEDKFVAVQDQILGSPRPGLVFSPSDSKMPPGDDERRRFEADLNRRLSGPNAGRALVTAGAWTVSPVTHQPADLGELEVSRYDLERTANCFGVPVAFLTTETNLANLEAAERQHARTGVDPRCGVIAAALTRLARRYDGRLLFCCDPACGEDAERTARVVDLKLKNGSLTVDEARAADGYDPVPWGAEPWLPGTLRQPSEPRPAPPAPPTPGQGPDAPQDGPDDGDPPTPDSEAGDAERRLLDGLTRTLATIEDALSRAATRPPADPGDGDRHGRDGDAADPAEGPPAGPAEGGGEHLWAADRETDQGPAPEVLPGAGEGGPGHDLDGRGAAADALSPAD